MGQAGGEDLRSAFSRGHPENCGEYLAIGESNPHEADEGHYRHESRHSQYPEVIIRAGDLEQLGDITEELMNYFVTTESDRQSTCCV